MLLLLGIHLWAINPAVAFALPYGESTVQEALEAKNKRIPTKKPHKRTANIRLLSEVRYH